MNGNENDAWLNENILVFNLIKLTYDHILKPESRDSSQN